jgi:hypothetical protein
VLLNPDPVSFASVRVLMSVYLSLRKHLPILSRYSAARLLIIIFDTKIMITNITNRQAIIVRPNQESDIFSQKAVGRNGVRCLYKGIVVAEFCLDITFASFPKKRLLRKESTAMISGQVGKNLSPACTDGRR